MPSKLPFMKFFPADWLSEPEVRQLSLAGKGLLIDLLALMWKADPRGTLIGEPDQIARSVGAEREDMDSALREIKASKACNVTESHGVVTIMSRRQSREEKERLQGRNRQRKYRSKDNSIAGNGSETTHISEDRGQRSEDRRQKKDKKLSESGSQLFLKLKATEMMDSLTYEQYISIVRSYPKAKEEATIAAAVAGIILWASPPDNPALWLRSQFSKAEKPAAHKWKDRG